MPFTNKFLFKRYLLQNNVRNQITENDSAIVLFSTILIF